MDHAQLSSIAMARQPLVTDPDLRAPSGRTTRIIARAAARAAINLADELLVLVATSSDGDHYSAELEAAGVEADRMLVLVTEPSGEDWTIDSLVEQITGTDRVLVIDHYVWERMIDQGRFADYEALRLSVEAEA